MLAECKEALRLFIVEKLLSESFVDQVKLTQKLRRQMNRLLIQSKVSSPRGFGLALLEADYNTYVLLFNLNKPWLFRRAKTLRELKPELFDGS